MAMDVSVQLRLLDALSAPARRAGQALAALKKEVQAIDRAGRSNGLAMLARQYDNLAARAERAQARMAALRGKALGAVAGAVGLSLPLKQAADYQLALMRFAQISGWAENERAERIRETAKLLTEVSRVTRQSSDALLQGLTTMVNLGMPANDAIAAIREIGRAATASGADVDDLARTLQAAYEHLKLPTSASEQLFNILHQASKLGGFELKDMARFFPSFLASYGALYADYIKRSTAGMTPEQAAKWRADFALLKLSQIAGWAQIVRLGAGDSMTAGTNLQNMLQKNLIEETSKAFEKQLGVNFRRRLWEHVNKGGDPIEFVASQLELLVQKNKGNPLFIGQLFADKQAMEGYIPVIRKFMQEKGQLGEFFAQIRAARDAGVITRDQASTWGTVSSAFAGFTNSLSEFWKTFLMLGAGDSMNWFFALLSDRLYDLVQVMQQYPKITAYVVRGLTGIMAVIGGLAVFRYAMAAASLGLARAGMGAIALARIIPGLATALMLGGRAMGFFTRHALLFGTLGLAGLLALKWRNDPDSIGGFLDYLNEAYPKAAQAFFDGADQLIKGFEALREWLFPQSGGSLGGFIDRFKEMFPGLSGLLDSLTQRFSDFFRSLPTGKDVVDALTNAFIRLWEALKYLFTGEGSAASLTGFRENIGKVGDAISDRFPIFSDLSKWFEGWQAQFSSDSWMTRAKAYLQAFGVGLLGLMGVNFAAMGPEKGLVTNLIILRSLVLVAGLAVAVLQLFLSVLAPLIYAALETLFEAFPKLFRGLLLFGGLAVLFGIMAAKSKEFRAAFSGFISGVWEQLTAATQALTEAWTELMVAIFGEDEATPDKLKELFETWKEYGQIAGSVLAFPIRLLAGAVRLLADAMKALKNALPEREFGYVTGLLGLAAAGLALRKAWMWLIGAKSGGGIMGKLGAGFLGLLGGYGLGRVGQALTGPFGKYLFKTFTLGGGPIGFALMFLGVLQLIRENIDAITSAWEKFLGLFPRNGAPLPGHPSAPPGGVEGPLNHWLPQSGSGAQSGESWAKSEIEHAATSAGSQIEGAGSYLAGILRRIGAEIASALGAINSAASISAPSVEGRARGALSDGSPVAP
jgi:hypothetical protein